MLLQHSTLSWSILKNIYIVLKKRMKMAGLPAQLAVATPLFVVIESSHKLLLKNSYPNTLQEI